MRISSLFCAIVALCLSATSAQALCTKDATIDQLVEAGKKGEQAFADGDLKALHNWAGQAREEIIPCMRLPLSPKQAAVFHRLMALDGLTRYNFKRVVSELHAARRLDPGYTIPPEVAEGDHPLLTYYEDAAKSPDGNAEPIYAPENGYVIVGGVRNAPRLSQTPVIIQVYGENGEWVETRYIQSGEKLPIWGKNIFGATAKDLGIDTQPTWQKPTPWYISAGVSAALAAVFYGLAMSEKSKFDDRSTPDGDLPGHRDRANAFGITSVSTAGLAAILTGIGVGFHFGFGGSDRPTFIPAAVRLPNFTMPVGVIDE